MSRWSPKRVAKIVQLKDDCEFPVTFTIYGNHLDLQGNPIPYERTTQRGKWVRPSSIRYRHWKTYVLKSWVEQVRKSPPCETDGRYRLDCHIYLLKDPRMGRGCGHGDPENIRKGIQDALFQFGDQHVIGSVEYDHVEKNPCVVVTVVKNPAPIL